MGEQWNNEAAMRWRQDEILAALAKLEIDTANVASFTERAVAGSATGELVAEILRGVALAGTAALQVADEVRKRRSRPDCGAAPSKPEVAG